MNKLLSLSLSISIMFFTAYAGYYICKEDKAKTEKRGRLNNYYKDKFTHAHMNVQDPETPRYIAENSIKELDKLETHMLKDGYDRAEVETMRTLAYKEAYATITAFKEYKSSAEYKEMQALIKNPLKNKTQENKFTEC